MTITNGYCTLATLKTHAAIDDAIDDARLESVINAVSRLIDTWTRRRFYATPGDETRYYTAQSDAFVLTDDIISVTNIATDTDGSGSYATAWVSTDYQLSPFNASALGQPYTEVRVRRNGSQKFNPCIEAGVRVVGKFGVSADSPWQAIVSEACLIQCVRLFKRKDSPFGVAGSNEFGQLIMLRPKLDPDVELMLTHPIRRLQG